MDVAVIMAMAVAVAVDVVVAVDVAAAVDVAVDVAVAVAVEVAVAVDVAMFVAMAGQAIAKCRLKFMLSQRVYFYFQFRISLQSWLLVVNRTPLTPICPNLQNRKLRI